MKTNNTSAFRLALTALICATLTTTSLHAQTNTSDVSATTVQPSLKTAIWAVANSSSVRISFDKQGRGAVRVRIYDSRGRELYDQYESTPAFAGKYDLSELSAGIYTIDLRYGDVHVSQTISLDTPQPEPRRIALLKASGADNRFLTIR